MAYSAKKNFGLRNNLKILLFTFLWLIPKTEADEGCSRDKLTFEIMTGVVYSAPGESSVLIPGTLHLTECLSFCRENVSCEAVNFETGLCVLFSSSAKEKPSALNSSQFPVFTIYAHKLCLKKVGSCDREWTYERVLSYELLDRSRKKVSAKSALECMELCLEEKEFECRSANYHQDNEECVLNDADRHSVSPQKFFLPADEKTEYLENNCVDHPVRLCEFRKINGKILKTVDAVFQDIETLEDCRKKCLSVNYRCHSFDFDQTKSVCRLSHLSSNSLSHIQDPYLEIPGSSTFESASCYNVTIDCRSREMVARIRTTRLFNGKVYARSRPNSCVTDVVNSQGFEIRMAYHDLNCDVKQQGISEFTNDIVIQHHDMIVTNQDLGVTVHCQYDLANRSIAHGVRMEVSNELETYNVHSVNVGSPNVTMKVTDRFGSDLTSAQVGDPLALRFEIVDENSPYEIFVRELVAMDGLDNSEILLIDALGCPTDALVMGAVHRLGRDSKTLEAAFDAFKFPTSEIVQFKALVTPCLSSCQAVDCNVHSFEGSSHRMESMGKRRRRKRNANGQGIVYEEEEVVEMEGHKEVSGDGHWNQASTEDEVVVVKAIHITDKFGFEKARVQESSFDDKSNYSEETSSTSSTCLNIAGLIVSCSLFLVAQLVVLLAYAFIWNKKSNKPKYTSESSRSIDMIYNSHRRDSACTENYGIDNPYRSDISPYDTVYNLPRPHSRHY